MSTPRDHRRWLRLPGRAALARLSSSVRHLRVVGLSALLGLMIVAFFVALSTQAASRQRPAALPSGEWVPLASTAPADVLAAARATTLYQAIASHPQTLLGQAVRQGALGTPVLVRAFHPLPGMHDVWVIPLTQTTVPGLSTPGPHVVALLDLDYDRARQQVRAVSFAGPFQPGEPSFGKPFPRQTQQAASAIFTGAVHAPIAASTPPELVYFPANIDNLAGTHAQGKWSGGGQFPDLAVWHVQSADGHDYLVGLDSQTYQPAQLPWAQGAS